MYDNPTDAPLTSGNVPSTATVSAVAAIDKNHADDPPEDEGPRGIVWSDLLAEIRHESAGR